MRFIDDGLLRFRPKGRLAGAVKRVAKFMSKPSGGSATKNPPLPLSTGLEFSSAQEIGKCQQKIMHSSRLERYLYRKHFMLARSGECFTSCEMQLCQNCDYLRRLADSRVGICCMCWIRRRPHSRWSWLSRTDSRIHFC